MTTNQQYWDRQIRLQTTAPTPTASLLRHPSKVQQAHGIILLDQQSIHASTIEHRLLTFATPASVSIDPDTGESSDAQNAYAIETH